MAAWSNGACMNMIINQTIDLANFVWFLKIFYKWLKTNDSFGYSKLCILLDNWTVHKSHDVTDWFKKMNKTVLFIPAYSPDFAQVEMCFSLIKRKLTEICKKETIKLTLIENYSKIFDSLISVKTDVVKAMFGKFYKTVRMNL